MSIFPTSRRSAEYVRAVVSAVTGPVVLVGHSYGGSVITNAARGNPNVRALIYIAGFAADVPPRDARLMAIAQRPITAAALNEPSGEPAWRSIPSPPTSSSRPPT